MKPLIALLLLCTGLRAQNTPGTLLWEVSRQGSPFKSYLFGTFHEVEPAFFATLNNTMDKLKSADVVYVEESSGQATPSPALFSKLGTWNHARWDSLLAPEQQVIFREFISRAERPDFYKLPPLVLNRTVSGMYFLEFCPAAGRQSYELMDTYIERLARQHRKPVSSLDRNQGDLLQQVAATRSATQDSMYAGFCVNFMQKMLQDDTKDCALLDKYKRFEVDYQLNTDLTQTENRSPLLIERNNQWTATLEIAMNTRNCFVAIGLRHLFYKQGLIEQLRFRGFLVTPIAAS